MMNMANLCGANLENAYLNDVKATGLKIDVNTTLKRACFESSDLADIDFCGIDLSFCSFDYAFIHNCNLSKCITNNETTFRETNLTKTKATDMKIKLMQPQKIYGCDFSRSYLRSSNFSGLVLKWADVLFKNSDLNGAIFDKCGDLSLVDFSNSVLSFAKFTQVSLPKNLSGLDMGDTQFVQMDFTDTNMTGCHLDNSTFVGCVLKGVDLHKAHTTNINIDAASTANMDKANLQGCKFNISFSGASLKDANLTDCTFTKTDFSKANLKSSDFSRSNLDAANFKGATLNEATLTGCSLIRANFGGAKMNKVKMNRCQLMAASFVGAELEKANLSGSNLEHADFQQIIGTECKFDKCNLVCAVFVPASFKLAKRKKEGVHCSPQRRQFQKGNHEGNRFKSSRSQRSKFSRCRLDELHFDRGRSSTWAQ